MGYHAILRTSKNICGYTWITKHLIATEKKNGRPFCAFVSKFEAINEVEFQKDIEFNCKVVFLLMIFSPFISNVFRRYVRVK